MVLGRVGHIRFGQIGVAMREGGTRMGDSMGSRIAVHRYIFRPARNAFARAMKTISIERSSTQYILT